MSKRIFRGVTFTATFIDELSTFDEHGVLDRMSDGQKGYVRIRVDRVNTQEVSDGSILVKFEGKLTLTHEQYRLFGPAPRQHVLDRLSNTHMIALPGTLTGDIHTVIEDRVKELEQELERYRKKYGVL